MRNAFIKEIYMAAQKDKDIIMMVGDLGYGVMNTFIEGLPDQFINAGISEQNMSSLAAGMALMGKKMFTYSIGNFPSLRCIEQIRNDICYHNANVKIISVGAGMSYGAMGMSHHAIDDMGAFRSIPNMRIYTPADRNEAIAVAQEVLTYDGPCYIRLGKGNERVLLDDVGQQQVNEGYEIHKGDTIAILATGAICEEALLACKDLKTEEINISVYSIPLIKPINEEYIKHVLLEHTRIYTLEEHEIIGGLGSAVCEVIAENSIPCKCKRLGIRNIFTSEVGSQKYLRDYYGISSKGIINQIKGDLSK